MITLQLWMRIVGGYYLLLCAGALARQPIRTEGPPGVLESAAQGDATARFVVDTWVTLGLLIGVLGASLIYFSGNPGEAHVLAMTVIAIELGWGIPIDIYRIVRGGRKAPSVVFIGIHSVIIVTGVLALTQNH